jgi:hypothetical protein
VAVAAVQERVHAEAHEEQEHQGEGAGEVCPVLDPYQDERSRHEGAQD